jgi:hypothetical protein
MRLWQRLSEKRKGLKMKGKKEKLFAEIAAELESRCDCCMFAPGDTMACRSWLHCNVPDDWETAIMSLDKVENWPCAFAFKN